MARSELSRMAWRVVRLALGVVFLILGVVGLLLPLVPQIPFFIAAALLLAPEFPPVRRALFASFRRWPKARRSVPKKLRNIARKDRR